MPTQTPAPNDPPLYLRFFDQLVALRSDAPNFVNLFGQMYRHLLVAPEPGLAASAWPVSITTHGAPTLHLGDEARRLGAAGLLDGFVYETVLYAILARVRSHFLAHAGAVAREGRGLVLAGESGHGKTTLVLELARRGWDFLSDELAALSRTDGRLHPFPRALRLRADTLARVGLALPPSAVEWQGKYLVDVDDLLPGRRGAAADLSAVVLLDTGAPITGPQPLTVRVDRADATLLDAIRALPGVTGLEASGPAAYPLLTVQASDRMPTLAAIEALCQAQAVLILDVVKRAEQAADFSQPPLLTPLTPSEAAAGLLAHFQGGHHAALLQADFNGQATRLFLAVTRLVASAHCYRLRVGPLAATADLVEGVLSARG